MGSNPRLKSRNSRSYSRKVHTRDAKSDSYCNEKIVLSFKDYIPNALKRDKQSFSTWEQDQILSQLNDKLKILCNMTMSEAKQNGIIKEYSSFPEKSDFSCPDNLNHINTWASFNRISGQKCRIAGYIVENIFNVVFLDKNHRFYITEKKHT